MPHLPVESAQHGFTCLLRPADAVGSCETDGALGLMRQPVRLGSDQCVQQHGLAVAPAPACEQNLTDGDLFDDDPLRSDGYVRSLVEQTDGLGSAAGGRETAEQDLAERESVGEHAVVPGLVEVPTVAIDGGVEQG